MLIDGDKLREWLKSACKDMRTDVFDDEYTTGIMDGKFEAWDTLLEILEIFKVEDAD